MNVVREIQRINEKELLSGGAGSWHDQYKDSAYIYVGGLPYQLTEGDVITIFSEYGEILDISMPRDTQTGKSKGFAFLMYADQRSTVLAVDNLGGSQVLNRTLKVDHVLNYKQLERDEETGKMKERENERLAAHPAKFVKLDEVQESEPESDSSHPSIDIDDPMRDYLIEQRRAQRKGGKNKKRAREGETKEERRKRRDEKKRRKEERQKGRGIEPSTRSRNDRHDSCRSRTDDRDRKDDRDRRDGTKDDDGREDRFADLERLVRGEK